MRITTKKTSPANKSFETSKLKLKIVLFAVIFCVSFNLVVRSASAADPGQYYKGNGGYGRVLDTNFSDLDYAKDFSLEVVIDVKPYENKSGWEGIMTKLYQYGLYNSAYAGWGLGMNGQVGSYGATFFAKVGDGTSHAQATSQTYTGRIHLIMAWNATTKTITLYVNGVQDGTSTVGAIVASNIDTTNDFWLGKSLGNLTSPIMFARLWNRDLSTDVSTLYDNYNATKQHELPSGFDTTELVSEWLMFDKSNSSGGVGTTHIKDNVGQNHIELMSGADIVSSAEALTLVSPADSVNNQNKSVTLSASGGYGTLSGLGTVDGPVQYYFQVDETDTFDSINLRESDWIADMMAWQPILKPSTTYYWRVKVKDSKITPLISSYTATRSFTTQEPTTWYVRPVGGSYGLENGATYDNAWDGLLNVIWGEGGVEAGDTLYVSGLQVFNMASWGTNSGNIFINATGLSDENPIIIRGDYPADPGVLWGAYKISYNPWISDGNGVYHIALIGSTFEDWFFQDVSQASYTMLTRQISLVDAQATSGSFYKSGQTLYVHTTDGGDPTGRVLVNSYGYKFVLNPAQYIKFLNFKWYNPSWACSYGAESSTRCSHITWDGLTMAYGVGNAFSFYDHMNYMKILNSDISWMPNGIYNISTTNDAPSNYLYRGNQIHDIGVNDFQQNGDAHCIGIQGGNQGIMENNECYNAGTGPLIYAFTDQILTNTLIRNNYVHDLHNLGGATGYGVSTMCNNNSLSDKTGNKAYGNIIVNCSVGLRFQFEDLQEVYNNTVMNCTVGYTSARTYLTYGPSVSFKNNLIVNSGASHINFATGATNTGFESDYNLFYPDGAAKFVKSVSYNFSGWQALSQVGFVFDPNSKIADPLFTNASGNFSAVTDFQLQPSSPAINAGTDVGLTEDYAGNPIVGVPDIGAYEYQGSDVTPPSIPSGLSVN